MFIFLASIFGLKHPPGKGLCELSLDSDDGLDSSLDQTFDSSDTEGLCEDGYMMFKYSRLNSSIEASMEASFVWKALVPFHPNFCPHA